jgi:O-antigen ligase
MVNAVPAWRERDWRVTPNGAGVRATPAPSTDPPSLPSADVGADVGAGTRLLRARDSSGWFGQLGGRLWNPTPREPFAVAAGPLGGVSQTVVRKPPTRPLTRPNTRHTVHNGHRRGEPSGRTPTTTLERMSGRIWGVLPPGFGRVAGRDEPLLTRLSFWALVLFAGTVPLEGMQHLGPLGSAPRAAGLLSALLAVVAVFTTLPLRRLPRTYFLFASFVVWVILSNLWTTVPKNTQTRTGTYLQLLFLAWILWQQLRTTEHCRWAMRGYVAGVAVGCLYTAITRKPHTHGVARFAVGDPNSFGVYIVIGILMAYHLFVTAVSRRAKAVYVGCMLLGVLGVFLTVSRTAVVVLGVTGLITILDRRTLTPARIAGLVSVVMVAAFVVIKTVTTQQLGRLGTIQSAAQSGFNQRTTYWRLAFDTFSRHPLLGVGANAFRDQSVLVTGISRVAHNSFLGVLADMGIIGLTLFILALASAWVQVPKLPRRLRQTWMAIGVAWFLGANTLTWEHLKITWFLAFLVVAEVSASRLAARAAADRPTPAVLPIATPVDG